ncbi:MAG: Hsp70 family protein [Chloroflexota bacterium]
MRDAIGIHFGSQNVIGAYIRKTEPRVFDNLDNEPITSSVVHLTEGGEWIVGKTAKKASGMSEEDAANTVFSIRQYIGHDFDDKDYAEAFAQSHLQVEKAQNGEVEIILRGRRFSPPVISAFLLEYLKRSAESFVVQEVRHAVISVPASFGIRQINATRLAGRLAGLNVLRIIPEPTAATLAYGIASESNERMAILVYDFEDDAFEAIVMLIDAGVYEIQGRLNDTHLGGDNFDYKIMDWIFEQIRIQHGVDLRSTANKEVKFRLKQAAEDAKLSLSKTTRTQIVWPVVTKQGGKIIDLECELKREDFNGMIKPLVDRSVDLVYEAIKLARTTPDGIDAILLVGGSMGVPLVVDTIRSIFGSKVIRGEINPMYCVAQGAAIETMLVKDSVIEADRSIIACEHCGMLNLESRLECRGCGKELKKDITVFLTTSYPIGTRMAGGRMDIIIPEGTIYYPTKYSKTIEMKTTYDGQGTIRFPIFEGRDESAAKNQILGYVCCRLAPGLPEATSVELSFWIDDDGIIALSARIPTQPWVQIEVSMQWMRDKAH